MDTEAHSLNCNVILKHIPEAANHNVNNLFGDKVQEMKAINEVFDKIMNLRSKLLGE